MHLLKGVLAGAAIGFGGFLFLVITYLLPNEIGKILGALLFPIGLSLVCIFNLNLFTGKIGLVFEEKKDKEFYISLPIMYIGNFIGALTMGYLTFVIFKDTDVFNRLAEVASSRTNYVDFYSYLACLAKSFLCGLCVYLAVKSYALCKKMYAKFILVFIFIGLFVYVGGEHCIANMYYFSSANAWSWQAIVNILIVTIGNILGTLPGIIMLKNLK